MNDWLSHSVRKFLHQHARHRVQLSILAALALVVIAATTRALVLPGIAMTPAHIHDESCYTQLETIEKQVLACPVSASAGQLVIHQHDQRCYDENGALVCTLQELAEHTHTEACYGTLEAHTHTDACYTEVRGELLCGLGEDEEHVHTDECYAQQKVLTCGQTEHAQIEGVLLCGKQEVVLHLHNEDCYAENGTLSCTLPEVISHQHTDSCFETIQVSVDPDALTCTNTDAEHVHTALCYGAWALTCGQTEEVPATDDASSDEEAPPLDKDLPSEETSDEDASDEEDGPLLGASNQVQLEYYVYLDNGRKLIKQESMVLPTSSDGRHYVTGQQLEAVYGAFGFHADAFNGEVAFPHTDSYDPSIIWADAPAYQKVAEDGTTQWCIPVSIRTTSYIYYLPNNTPGHSSYFTGSKGIDDSGVISDNSYYTVSVSGPSEAAEENGISYVLNGGTCSIDLTMYEDYIWSFRNMADGTELDPSTPEPLENGKFRFTFENVSCPIKIQALKADVGTYHYTIEYHAATLSDNLENLSSEINIGSQSILSDGTVGGLATLTVQLEVNAGREEYRLRSPDTVLLAVRTNSTTQQKSVLYAFKGWRVKQTGDLLDPDKPLTALQLSNYQTGGKIQLEAVWSALDTRKLIASANFYINLNCEIKDSHNNGFDSSSSMDEYTKSLFTVRVLGSENLPTVSDGFLLLAPPTTQDSAYDVDTTLRAMTSQPYQGVTLAAFPDDETMLDAIRSDGYTIQISGKTIPNEYLTSDYFQIRWTSLKYRVGDGWHIDGVLVVKEAKLRVTKSFLGNKEAISEIKSQTGGSEYSIRVERVENVEGEINVKDESSFDLLTLVPANQETREQCIGYTSYDASSQTYTWIVSGAVDGTYRLSEQNYRSADVPSTAVYRISDTSDSGRWEFYSDETQVITAMDSYASDMPQRGYRTVAFQNAYIDTGVLTVEKIDSFTRNGIANVAFTLTADDSVLRQTLYRRKGTNLYTNSKSAGVEYTQVDTAVTDAIGNIYLQLLPGGYTLREALPTGYHGTAEIHFTVDEDGKLTELTYDGPSPAFTTHAASHGVGTSFLLVENNSRLLTTVTAVKDWGDLPESWKKPVTVTLMCNDVPLGDISSSYTQVLNAENNWTYTWKDVPLFTDGKVAVYSLHEVMIGDTPHNATLPGGYSDYTVTRDPPQYREGDTGPYTDQAAWKDDNGTQHYANHVLLTVHNRPQGEMGVLTVEKLFTDLGGESIDPVAGTYTFAVYENADGTGTPAATASVVFRKARLASGDGTAHFTGLLLGKTYYVFELDDSGRPVANGTSSRFSGTPFTAYGSGAVVTLTPESPEARIAITNRINYTELPQTGGIGVGLFYFAGGLTMLCAALLLLRKRAWR